MVAENNPEHAIPHDESDESDDEEDQPLEKTIILLIYNNYTRNQKYVNKLLEHIAEELDNHPLYAPFYVDTHTAITADMISSKRIIIIRQYDDAFLLHSHHATLIETYTECDVFLFNMSLEALDLEDEYTPLFEFGFQNDDLSDEEKDAEIEEFLKDCAKGPNGDPILHFAKVSLKKGLSY